MNGRNAGTLAVIAKAPVAGRVKTRLCPPCTLEQAADLARAAMQDTLDAVRATPAARRVLVLDGEPEPWMTFGMEVIAQGRGGLELRLADAFDALGGPTFLVGMDTPQVTPALLGAGLAALDEAPAVLGAAPDGGYWSIGLRRADRRVFEAIPMSVAETANAQRARLAELGLNAAELPALRDVDDIDDVHAVAVAAPETHFARAFAALDLGVLT